MTDLDAVVAGLEAAKRKLQEAKVKALQAASTLGRAEKQIGHALGRSGLGSPLLAQMRAKEKSVLARVMELDTTIRRVDAAIAQARGAAAPPRTSGPG